jgi:hypothetical protein
MTFGQSCLYEYISYEYNGFESLGDYVHTVSARIIVGIVLSVDIMYLVLVYDSATGGMFGTGVGYRYVVLGLSCCVVCML